MELARVPELLDFFGRDVDAADRRQPAAGGRKHPGGRARRSSARWKDISHDRHRAIRAVPRLPLGGRSSIARTRKTGSAPFRAISRQVLFEDPALECELRYFEMAPGGYSTLERHQHMHAVMIFRGHGHCLLGSAVWRCSHSTW